MRLDLFRMALSTYESQGISFGIASVNVVSI